LSIQMKRIVLYTVAVLQKKVFPVVEINVCK
jgi:hypothetical protein